MGLSRRPLLDRLDRGLDDVPGRVEVRLAGAGPGRSRGKETHERAFDRCRRNIPLWLRPPHVKGLDGARAEGAKARGNP